MSNVLGGLLLAIIPCVFIFLIVFLVMDSIWDDYRLFYFLLGSFLYTVFEPIVKQIINLLA